MLGAGNPQPQAFLNRLGHVRRQRPHRIEQLAVNSERGEFLRVTVRHGENRMNKLATRQVEANGALQALLEAARGLPDLLKARREAMEARWGRRA